MLVIYIVMFTNPLYHLGRILIQVMPAAAVGGIFFDIIFAAMWFIISYIIADISARENGYFIPKLFLFWVFNFWAIAVVYYLEGRVRRLKASSGTSRRILESQMTSSSLVAGAVNIYTPADLGDHFIQTLVEEGRYTEAVDIARNRIDAYMDSNDREMASRYESLITWIENERDNNRDSQES